uniref:DIX domain-containing protein n=1 Tax=Strigamia maritima TaxID=126957 RepID=T1J3M8_STRMM
MVLHSSTPNMDLVVARQKEPTKENSSEKEDMIRQLQKELTAKDRLINQQRTQLDETTKHLSQANKTKTLLASQLQEQDRKLAMVQKQQDTRPVMKEELHVVNEALNSLRRSFRSCDPQHHTLDTIEQSISLLMERLHEAEMLSLALAQNGRSRFKRTSLTSHRATLALTDVSAICNSHIYPLTKIIYFNENLTPSLTTISKRLGDITLLDFKKLLNQPGELLRYHFKTMDPEFGIVKEEIMHDDDILPGMDGKIIAWVESKKD